jgi:hypothetical protein
MFANEATSFKGVRLYCTQVQMEFSLGFFAERLSFTTFSVLSTFTNHIALVRSRSFASFVDLPRQYPKLASSNTSSIYSTPCSENFFCPLSINRLRKSAFHSLVNLCGV